MNDLIQKRIQQLRDVCKEEQVDYYMVPTADFHNSEYVDSYFKTREYLSNFSGSNGTLLVGKEFAGLWTDGRYFIQAEAELLGTGIELFRMLEEGVPTIEEYLSSHMKEGDILGFDGRVVSTSSGLRFEKIIMEKGGSLSFSEDLTDKIWKDRPQMPGHPVLVLDESICGLTVEEKLTAVRKEMIATHTTAFVLSKLDDLMWLFNIRGKDIECNPVAMSYGFITLTECYLFIQECEITEELKKHAEKYQITIKDYSEIIPFLSTYSYAGPVLYDSKNISYRLYKMLEQSAELVCQSNPTELLKAKKNSTELDQMRAVYLEDSAAVCKFIYWLHKNVGNGHVNELSAAEKLDSLRSQIGSYLDLSFPTICGYKENAAMMHYEATPEQYKEIKPEGMLLVDSGGQYLGGTTDVTRTMILGPVSEEEKIHFTAVTVGMLQLTAAKFLQGCTGKNLDILARQPIWDMNIDYRCGTGHGIGFILNVHEGPHNIRWRFTSEMAETVLEKGMVVTNEPGIYIEGSHGIRIENVMVVTEAEKNEYGQFLSFETLTFVPIDKRGLENKCLDRKDVERLNRYHEEVYQKISPYLSEEEKVWLQEETAPISL